MATRKLLEDNDVAVKLRTELEWGRAHGLSFGAAWREALPLALAEGKSTVDIREWTSVLTGTKPAWRAGYERTSDLQWASSLRQMAVAA